MAPDMNGAGPSSQPIGSGSPKKRPRHSDSASSPLSTTTTTKKRIKPTTVFANGPSGSASANGNGVASATSSSSSPSSTPHPNSLAATRARLPITSSRDQIVSSIRSNETIILIADTGSGKSTQVPQFLHEAGGFTEKGRLVGITQPRRMAAISLAKRVGQELGESDADAAGEDGVSPLVGYAIRFQDKTTRRTRIKFMTDGWLLREFVRGAAQLVKQGMDIDEVDDPSHPGLLPQYSCLIIDEAHERSVRTDLLLGLAKRVQRRRQQLRKAWEGKKVGGKEPQLLHIVVMSATLDADLFSRFFANNDDDPDDPRPAPVLYVQGRTHPVTLSHLLEPATDWIDAAKRQILQLHVSRTLPGDILVFGTGAEEIESLCSSLRHLSAHLPQWAEDRQRATGQKTVVGGLHVVPLYAALGNKAVAEVYRPTPKGMRKVVVATNIAETSVTIPGVRYVVDCGLAKEKMHVAAGAIAPAQTQQQHRQVHQSQQQGIETLTTRPISQSAASQRAGRAGREAPGECFRLYPRTELEAMDETTVPEIHRTELSSVALDCFAAGVDPRDVEWVDRPVGGRLDAAELELGGMGAVRAAPKGEGDEGKKTRLMLTELGQRMALLPLPPRFSHLLITAATSSSPAVVRQARDLVAILSSERTIFLEPSAAALLSTSANGKPNGVGGKEEGGGSDISERLELKRAEAGRARSAFRHWSGDHVTMLRTFYAYLRVKESAFAAASTATNGSSNGKLNGSSNGNGHQASTSARAKATAEVKTWCNAHFLSLRALREIEEIRDQIDGICVRAGILPKGSGGSDAQDKPGKSRGRVNGAGRGQGGEDAGDSSESSESSDDDDESDEDAPLRVIKRGQKAKDDGDGDEDSHLLDDADEDYSLLRRCLVSGRSLAHLATRQGGNTTSSTSTPNAGSSSYRVLCGREVFKLHPTSSLHPSRSTTGRGNVQLPKMVVFEELQFTTQLYVRCASAVDVEWVREMAGLGNGAAGAGGAGVEGAVKGE